MTENYVMLRQPMTPGEILLELYLEPAGVSVEEFADLCGITSEYMKEIVSGHAPITGEIAVKITEMLGTTSPRFWLNLQYMVDRYNVQEK
jgi:addiction module HigA family antidote